MTNFMSVHYFINVDEIIKFLLKKMLMVLIKNSCRTRLFVIGICSGIADIKFNDKHDEINSIRSSNN